MVRLSATQTARPPVNEATRGRLEALQRALQLRLARATLEIHNIGESVANGSGGDDGELAGERTQEDVIFAESELYQTDLGQITVALERLNRGTYGLCVVCGKPISSARLTILPAALRHVACSPQVHPKAVPLHPSSRPQSGILSRIGTKRS